MVEVARGVFVATSEKYETSSTVILSGSNAVLVDPAWTVAELNGLRDWLRAGELEVSAGFSTHAHHDHLLWHPDFGDAPRWASPTTIACVAEWGDELRTMMDDDYPADWPDPFLGLLAAESHTLPEPFGESDETLELFELVIHNGHAPGHTAVLLSDRGVLLAGDMLSDIELPLPFMPDDLPGYLAALDALAPAVSRATVLVPGHGSTTDQPMERLDADRRYLDDVIAGRDPDDPRRGLKGMAEAHERSLPLPAISTANSSHGTDHTATVRTGVPTATVRLTVHRRDSICSIVRGTASTERRRPRHPPGTDRELDDEVDQPVAEFVANLVSAGGGGQRLGLGALRGDQVEIDRTTRRQGSEQQLDRRESGPFGGSDNQFAATLVADHVLLALGAFEGDTAQVVGAHASEGRAA